MTSCEEGFGSFEFTGIDKNIKPNMASMSIKPIIKKKEGPEVFSINSAPSKFPRI